MRKASRSFKGLDGGRSPQPGQKNLAQQWKCGKTSKGGRSKGLGHREHVLAFPSILRPRRGGPTGYNEGLEDASRLHLNASSRTSHEASSLSSAASIPSPFSATDFRCQKEGDSFAHVQDGRIVALQNSSSSFETLSTTLTSLGVKKPLSRGQRKRAVKRERLVMKKAFVLSELRRREKRNTIERCGEALSDLSRLEESLPNFNTSSEGELTSPLSSSAPQDPTNGETGDLRGAAKQLVGAGKSSSRTGQAMGSSSALSSRELVSLPQSKTVGTSSAALRGAGSRAARSILQAEIEQFNAVRCFPAFQKDPFGTMSKHLRNSLRSDKRKKERREGREDNSTKAQQHQSTRATGTGKTGPNSHSTKVRKVGASLKGTPKVSAGKSSNPSISVSLSASTQRMKRWRGVRAR